MGAASVHPGGYPVQPAFATGELPMLRQTLIHPPLLEALGRAGHGSGVLIADANYPHSTTLGPNARLIHLNLMPGLVSATDALRAVCAAIPVERARVMETLKEGPYAMTEDPPIWDEFRAALRGAGNDAELEPVERFAFYEQAGRPDMAVTIATGEQRLYGNILLTLGAIVPE